MINPFKDTNWNPDLADRRKFAKSLMIGFPILATVMSIIARLHTGIWKPGLIWLGIIGFAAGLIFWIVPQIAKPFYLAWYFLACCMGIVMGNLIIASFFFLVFTPAALIMRALGRDRLDRRFDPQAKSYWRDVEKVVDPQRYFQQY
jgi:hypothetical protein